MIVGRKIMRFFGQDGKDDSLSCPYEKTKLHFLAERKSKEKERFIVSKTAGRYG